MQVLFSCFLENEKPKNKKINIFILIPTYVSIKYTDYFYILFLKQDSNKIRFSNYNKMAWNIFT